MLQAETHLPFVSFFLAISVFKLGYIAIFISSIFPRGGQFYSVTILCCIAITNINGNFFTL